MLHQTVSADSVAGGRRVAQTKLSGLIETDLDEDVVGGSNRKGHHPGVIGPGG